MGRKKKKLTEEVRLGRGRQEFEDSDKACGDDAAIRRKVGCPLARLSLSICF